MTIVELMVAITIIGILVALMLPAIAACREASRRVSCQNNLRQLALACHSFHEANRSLPPQNFTTVPSQFRQPPGAISVLGQLLPYLEQAALYAKLDLNEWGEGNLQEPPSSRVNASLLGQQLSVLLCPSDQSSGGATNYRACLGSGPGPPYGNRAGAFYSLGVKGRRATFAMMSDGLSNSAFCSERLVGDFQSSRIDPDRDVFILSGSDGAFGDPDLTRKVCAAGPSRPNAPHLSFSGATWLLNGYEWVWYNHVDTPNSDINDCTNSGAPIAQGKVTARSLHPGGVNMAMADGSVRFVSESIDLGVWRALGTRAGQDVVTEY